MKTKKFSKLSDSATCSDVAKPAVIVKRPAILDILKLCNLSYFKNINKERNLKIIN